MAIFPKIKSNQPGFSLIEILVFVTILNLFFIMALTVTIFSLRNLKQSEHKIVATHHLDQLKEWLLYEKEKDWETFSQIEGAYCFNKATLDWTSSSACSAVCPSANCLNEIYNRQAVFSKSENGSTSSVRLTISWNEIDQPVTITSETIFSVWEK